MIEKKEKKYANWWHEKEGRAVYLKKVQVLGQSIWGVYDCSGVCIGYSNCRKVMVKLLKKRKINILKLN